MAENTQRYDFDEARTYWRHAPSGSGKHDTGDMLRLPNGAFIEEWTTAFNRRFRQYAEESLWLRDRAREFAGKRVLSIGSGIGLHELYYLACGADVTCCDIVRTNLEVIDRAARIMGIGSPCFLISDGPDFDLAGPYDVVFIYGSLMTMPEAEQVRLMSRAVKAATSDATIVLMLYTWKFAADTCGWRSPEKFEPGTFARASDPSVGQEHCPWSDWHDDKKLAALFATSAPQGSWKPARRQLWNNDWYVWYDFTRTATGTATSYFEPEALHALEGATDVDLAAFAAADARISLGADGLKVVTTVNQFHYAAHADVDVAHRSVINSMLVSGRVEAGGLSASVLDDDRNAFIGSCIIDGEGRFRAICRFAGLPERARIVISNHRMRHPDQSSFVIESIRLGSQLDPTFPSRG